MNLDQSISQLREVAPQIDAKIDDLEADWKPDSVPVTVLYGEIARVVADLPSDERSRLLAYIEQQISAGDQQVREAATTGFVEALAAEVDQGRAELTSIRGDLGPETLAYWRAWDEFTGAQTPGLPRS